MFPHVVDNRAACCLLGHVWQCVSLAWAALLAKGRALAIVVVAVAASAVSGALAAGNMQLSSSFIELSAVADGINPVARLSISTDEIAATWQVRPSVPWLQTAPSVGRGSSELQLRVVPGALAPGQHEGVLYVRSSDKSSPVREVRVRYTLHPQSGVSVAAGHRQDVVIHQPPAIPFTARVLDKSGRPVSNATVAFSTLTGRTQPAQAAVVTDAEGLARFQPLVESYGAIEVVAKGPKGATVYLQAVGTGWLTTFAGDGVRAYGGDDGPARQAHFNAPFGMALREGDLILVDYFNHALRAISLDTGRMRPVAGNGRQGFNGDGLLALDSLLSGPFGIALMPGGDIAFSDYYNNRIRQIDRDSGRVSTLAGSGMVGYSGDGASALKARIDVPLDIAADSDGNVYLSDWHHHVVRRVDVKSGTIDTVAGIGERAFTGEGIASSAGLSTPLGLSFDSDDNLYIADYGNNRVRKVDARSGQISTIAGTGQRGFAGDGGPAVFARLNRPYNVYADDDGGLFISDAGNHRIRHLDLASGIITTIAGNGRFDYVEPTKLASQAPLMGPFSVIRDDDDQLYIAEYFGHRVRRIAGQKPEWVAAGKSDSTDRREERLLRQSQQIFGKLPAVAQSETNPVTAAKVALGRRLFHETALSADGTISCARCHPLEQYGMDGLALARGIGGKVGSRNTPTVFNAALQDSQLWDGRIASVEAQVREPLLNPEEMGMSDEAAVVTAVRAIPAYQPLFSAAFEGDTPLTFANISAALGAFQRSLLTPNAPFDRYLAGDSRALSAQQKEGLKVFLREGCASCHAGPLMGGQDIHLIAPYPDTRAGDRFEFRKRLGNTHKFKVPPLRNITRTAPYLHDGRYSLLAQSISRRLEAYQVREAGISDRVELTPNEMDAMVAFMKSLTSVIGPDYISLGFSDADSAVQAH